MQVLIQAAEGLITGVLAFLLGLLWQRVNKIVLNYRARRFWHPVMSKDVQLVMSRFRGLQGFEASGEVLMAFPIVSSSTLASRRIAGPAFGQERPPAPSP